MIKIVCNSSPIIGLCIIKKLNLLWELFTEVYITEEVYKEIVQNNELRAFDVCWQFRNCVKSIVYGNKSTSQKA